ncbi:high affinity cationic amino acid transporter 1-like [Diorhabda carinulata]|uniref:high affinity cationic amino acid transporter 1-like n=1 Tax=Diorhabda carinulata TaxID=1163345 RepID=UPI0025A0E759|nr:high affinity cationic amino acid transporter 1-like [Diorhabda carinulata]
MVSKLLTAITRKKKLDAEEPKTNLARVLYLLDLVLLGAGSTLGLGVYILAGSVAKLYAGPAVSISFLIAAVISLFGGLCYAEFAARVPRTGYAYAYCYAGVGELVAFIVGWNLLLGAVLGASSVASGMSSYLDTLVDRKISTTLRYWFPMDLPYLVSSPDFLALGIIMLLTVLLSVGMKESSIFNNICTALNLFTILTVIVACTIKADIKNWKIAVDQIAPKYKEKAGSGGFFPYGISGVIAGTPNCFYGFTGFDASAGCSEEAKNPKRDIPLAILITLFLVFVVYFTISTVLTLAWPYYLQSEEAPFTYVFDQFGWVEVKWIVTAGAVFALSSSVFGSMYFVPRIFYAMAEDGLIFKFLANVHPTTKTPLVSTVLSGSIAGILAAFLKLEALMDLMTIGAFFSYIVVAASVIVLRYENKQTVMEVASGQDFYVHSKQHYLESLFNISKSKVPTKTTSIVVNISAMFFTIISAVFCIIIINDSFFSSKNMQYITCSAALLLMIIIMLVIFRQPESEAKISFKVPLVPLIPCLSILFNLYLMMQLSLFTWMGFLGWIGIGCVVYFFYGIKHSVLNKEEGSREEVKI